MKYIEIQTKAEPFKHLLLLKEIKNINNNNKFEMYIL